MSRGHEQNLLHNWSNCRCRDRAKTRRSILGVSFADQFVLSKESSLQTHITATGNVSLRVRVKS
jgi:hypothetical protein